MESEEIEKFVAGLSSEGRALALRLLARERSGEWPGIEKVPGVCGGRAVLVRSRITVWLLEKFRRSGASLRELAESYPHIRSHEIENAWLYAKLHQEEIDRDIREQEEA